MKKLRQVLKSLLIASSLLLFAIPCYGFDRQVNKEAFEKRMLTHDAYYTFVRIITEGTADALYYNSDIQNWIIKEASFSLEGSGTVIAPGWIITAAHVVHPEMIEVASGKCSGFYTTPQKINMRFIKIHDYKSNPTIAWIRYIDHDRDIALLRYVPHGFLDPLDIKQSLRNFFLGKDDIIAIVTHERDSDNHLDSSTRVVWGKIVSREVYVPDPSSAPWFSMSDFTMDATILGGDSGSLVFAFIDGKPFWIGIARAAFTDYRSGDNYTYAAWVGKMVYRVLQSEGAIPKDVRR